MLTTGLLSLNIHEALAYDGTEIILHPELFSPEGGHGSSVTTGSLGTSTRHAAATAPGSSSIRPSSTATTTGVVSSANGSNTGATVGAAVTGGTGGGTTENSSNARDASPQPTQQQASSTLSQSAGGNGISSSQQQQQHGTITSAPSSDGLNRLSSGGGGGGGGGGNSSTASPPAPQRRLLEVGDMIEIRVWDPIPLRDRHQSPAVGGGGGGVSTVFRKRSPAATTTTTTAHSVQSGQSSTSASTDAKKSTTTILSKKSTSTSTTTMIPAAAAASTTPPIRNNPSQQQLDTVPSRDLSRKMTATHSSATTNTNGGSMQYSDFSDHVLPPISSKSLVAVASSTDTADNNTTANPLSPTSATVQIDPKSSKDETAVTMSPLTPAKNVITPASSTASLGGKPPVSGKQTQHQRSNTLATDFPRFPTGTGTGTGTATPTTAAVTTSSSSSNLLLKPPLQPRALSVGTHHHHHHHHGGGGGGDKTFAAYEARKRSTKPIHSREISDMTADSVMVHGLLQSSTSTIAGTQHHQLQQHPQQSTTMMAGGNLNLPSSSSPNNSNNNNNMNNPLDDIPIVNIANQPGAAQVEVVNVGGGRGEQEEEEEDTQADDTFSLIGKTHVMRFSFVMLVTDKALTSLKGSARTQVSMLRQVADLYKLSPYDMVSINRIEKDDEAAVLTEVSADFVLVSIKDQFISRGDMHLFQKQLLGSWIYEGQRLTETARGIKAHAWLIRHGNRPAKSGLVTEETMITFRSRSSRIFWLVQISAEMWDYASPYERERGEENESVCEIYFDKWISFVHRLFVKWKSLEVSHSLTVVFFSRTFLSSRQAISVNANGGSLDCKDVYGRPYEDHYKMVIENETKADWDSIVVKLKEEFLKYPLEVGWNLSTGDLGRRPSNASQGNVLEAINITSNLLKLHYLDRDLHRTGNSIVVISPGCGVFEVDKGLASITYQRMMDNGIGSDVLSLGLPPLHIAPFFLYNNEYHTVESRGVDTSETYYEIPHWMHLAFVSYEGVLDNASQIPLRASETDPSKSFHVAEQSLPVAANGFILPRQDSLDSIPAKVKVDPSSPTSFSVNGIAASSPEKVKRVPQERALNEGRDFLDILEACRPRSTGSMPSALQALLKMYRRSEKLDRAPSESFNDDTEDEGDTDELKPLREWTSMDLDLDEPPYKVMRPRSGSFGLNEKASERSDSSVLSSPSSSYTSLVGVSFDKHLLGRKSSAPLGGVHLQRSQSLQLVAMDPNEDTDTVRSEGSWSTMEPESSVGPATEDDLTSSKGAQKERSKHAAMLRKIQAQHDSSYFDICQVSAVVPPDPGHNRPQAFAPESVSKLSPVTGGISVPAHRFSANRNEPGQGGIGAALTHYTISLDAVTNANDSLPNRIRVLTPNEGIGATRAAARMVDVPSGLSGRNTQWNDLGSRALSVSPLLLPPPGLPSAIMADPPDVVRPEDRQLSSRLLPRDYRTLSSRDGGSCRSLNAGYSGRGLPPNNLISGELFSDQRNARVDIMSGVKTAGAGSPRTGDLYRSHGRRAERDKHGHRHRESTSSHRARKKVFNPFRQADEDKVLAKRSHNRRRWSHVFPQGEIEFKRHAGPNWKSLTSPAVLPLSVDYFPSRQEIDQFFQFNIYNVTLSDFEDTPYSTHADVLHEMVRQRVSQDYQLVPPSCVDDSFTTRPMTGHALYGSRGPGPATSVIPNLTAERNVNQKSIKHFLTMGHQLQELTYDPNTDTIEVVRFNEKNAQNDEMNTFRYEYLLYEPLTQKYTKVVQTFKKYANQYNWNKVDRIICGDEDKALREGMRFRRLTFGLIPPKFKSTEDEQDYIAKFKRLSEYLCKLKETDSATDDIKISATADQQTNFFETKTVTGVDSMRKATVQLRKGKHDPFEWIELATDFEFSTSKSYRIIFNWLAASSGKVDTQVQLLHRRSTQYGLSLVVFPQTSVSRDMLLNPFKAPPTFCVRDDEKAKLLYTAVLDLDFVNDGVFYTQTRPILECIEKGAEFDFGRRLSTAARQYVHRSGTLFVRLIRDRHGWVIVVVIPNGQHIKKDQRREATAKTVFRDLCQLIGSMAADEEEP